ncbi:FtsQ-type POTRA domain-containing protein [Acidimicrobiia bacterium]|nr:FtsQ-type POTRA domain-containing protein [Acidimicrobiia bacterium]
MNEFTQIQLRTFKSFLVFSLLVLVVSLTFVVTTSQKYRISQIDFDSNINLNLQSIDTLYGDSIWFVDENSFEDVYNDNPEIKNLSITKQLPTNLFLSVQLYEELTNIIDLRSSIKGVLILYENNYTVETKEIRNYLPVVEILNGPVGDGFNGEIISFFKTLDKYEYKNNLLKISYDGVNLNASYDKTIYELGDALDLGRKASVLGKYLSENSCEGIVRFITSESTIEKCK